MAERQNIWLEFPVLQKIRFRSYILFVGFATASSLAIANSNLSDIYGIVGDMSPALAVSRDARSWISSSGELLIGTSLGSAGPASSNTQLNALTIALDATRFEGLDLADCRRRFEMPWAEYARFIAGYGSRPPTTNLWESNMGGDSKGQFMRLQNGTCKVTLVVGTRFFYDPSIGFMGKRNPLPGYTFAQGETVKLGKAIFALGQEKRELYFVVRHNDLGTANLPQQPAAEVAIGKPSTGTSATLSTSVAASTRAGPVFKVMQRCRQPGLLGGGDSFVVAEFSAAELAGFGEGEAAKQATYALTTAARQASGCVSERLHDLFLMVGPSGITEACTLAFKRGGMSELKECALSKGGRAFTDANSYADIYAINARKQLQASAKTEQVAAEAAKTKDIHARIEKQAAEMKAAIFRQTLELAPADQKPALSATILQSLAQCIQIHGQVTLETCKEFQARAYRIQQDREDHANNIQRWDIVYSFLGRGRYQNGTHLSTPETNWREIAGCATWINSTTTWERDSQQNPMFRKEAINCGNFSAQRYYDAQTLRPYAVKH